MMTAIMLFKFGITIILNKTVTWELNQKDYVFAKLFIPLRVIYLLFKVVIKIINNFVVDVTIILIADS